MKPVGFGLAAAAMVAVLAGALTLGAPSSVQAQPRPARPAGAPPVAPPVTPAARTAGMTAAPAIIAASRLPCTLADARLIGTNGRGPEQQSFFELACTGGLGFVVAVKPNQPTLPPQAFTCIETAAQPNPATGVNPLHCVLPGNADQNAALQPFMQKAGATCGVSRYRAIGQTSTNTIIEVQCSEGTGYIVTMSVPPAATNPVVMVPCLAFDGTGNVNCQLSDRAALLANIDTLNSRSDRHCPVRDRRYVLTTRTGATFYEIACQDNSGYMLEVAATGAVTRTVPCATADYVNGGCTLTDARAAQTAEAGLYTGLATRAGFNCQVQRYAPLNTAVRGQDTVELQCSNRPDGAIGIFPVAAGQAAEIIPCGHALVAIMRCSFTPEANQYPVLTADLQALGRNSCAVSALRAAGVSQAEGKTYIEVACADGLLGYIIEFQRRPQIRATLAIACTLASGINGGCQLPGNVAARRAAAGGAAAPTPPARPAPR